MEIGIGALALVVTVLCRSRIVAGVPSLKAQTVLQIRIDLEEVDPPIWRRLLVPGASGSPGCTMSSRWPWDGPTPTSTASPSASKRYGMHFEDHPAERAGREEVHGPCKAIGKERQFRYEYDFGDGWQHQVVVEDTSTIPIGLTSRSVPGRSAFVPS